MDEQERLLRRVLGLVAVAKQRPADAVDHPAVLLVEACDPRGSRRAGRVFLVADVRRRGHGVELVVPATVAAVARHQSRSLSSSSSSVSSSCRRCRRSCRPCRRCRSCRRRRSADSPTSSSSCLRSRSIHTPSRRTHFISTKSPTVKPVSVWPVARAHDALTEPDDTVGGVSDVSVPLISSLPASFELDPPLETLEEPLRADPARTTPRASTREPLPRSRSVVPRSATRWPTWIRACDPGTRRMCAIRLVSTRTSLLAGSVCATVPRSLHA